MEKLFKFILVNILHLTLGLGLAIVLFPLAWEAENYLVNYCLVFFGVAFIAWLIETIQDKLPDVKGNIYEATLTIVGGLIGAALTHWLNISFQIGLTLIIASVAVWLFINRKIFKKL